MHRPHPIALIGALLLVGLLVVGLLGCAEGVTQRDDVQEDPKEVACDDLSDNDGDGDIDCVDTDCVGAAACAGKEVCGNGVDDDGDNAVDCSDTDCAGAATCNPLCGPGTADCDGNLANGCETATDTNNAHCGACAIACDQLAHVDGAACSGGKCGITACASGFGDCDGDVSNGCEADTTAKTTCGSSCTNCAALANASAPQTMCVSGGCVLACNVGYGNCDAVVSNGCEANTNATATACGTDCRDCTSGANVNASATTCSAGGCNLACSAGYGDCDGLPANGCETDTNTAMTHCGACGTDCGLLANVDGVSCGAGSCVIGSCDAGFGNCDGNAANGCEVNQYTDKTACGASCTDCTAGANVDTAATTCSAGSCAIVCSGGHVLQGGVCVAAPSCTTDANCAGPCEACVAGSCVLRPATYECLPSQNYGCIMASTCTGSSADCPAAGKQNAGWSCRVEGPVNFQDFYECDVAGQCLWVYYSCPILYGWDGSDFAFESDMYTSGTLGLKIGSGYRKPDPHDAYVLRQPLAENGGLLELRIVEELEEIDYLDEARLFAIDVPPNREVVAWANNVPGAALPIAQRLVSISTARQPLVSAMHLNTNTDVSATLAASDLDYLELSDEPNLMEWHTIELDLGDLSAASVIKLVVDGRSKFPYSGAGFGRRRQLDPNGWQTDLEVLDATGAWVQVPRSLVTTVKPKEFPRAMAIDISTIFLTSTYKVRLSWVNQTYLDAIWIDTTPNEVLTVIEAGLAGAELGYHGFSAHSGQDPIVYAYSQVGWAYWENPPGAYTRYGDVSPLLTDLDDMFVIFGPGDEVALSFWPPAPPAAAMKRTWALQTAGYYKQSNLTDGGAVPFTVTPLPFYTMSSFPYDETVESYPDAPSHQKYLQVWNTRLAP